MDKQMGIVVEFWKAHPAISAEVEAWYREEHVPRMRAVPGVLADEQWLCKTGQGHFARVALYDVESAEAAASSEWPPFPGQQPKWADRLEAIRLRGRQVWPGSVRGGGSDCGGLLITQMNIPKPYEEEFNRWFDDEHMPRLQGVPGVIKARRFQMYTGAVEYMGIYHLREPDVFPGPEWQAASNTEWSDRVRAHFVNHSRHICVPLT